MMKKILSLLLCILLCICVLASCTSANSAETAETATIETASQPAQDSAASANSSAGTADSAGDPAAQSITCTISINCETALDVNPKLANAVSTEGIILEGESVTLAAESTVRDALVATGVVFDDSAGYVDSIGSLGGGDCGAESGWLYSVNGEFASVGSEDYILEDGDVIAWQYTCDMGADIGASF